MLDKLERKFGKYAIKNLMRYIIVLYAIGFFLSFAMPEVYYAYFCLDAERILHGEVWRIVTFLLNSPSNNPIFVYFFPLFLLSARKYPGTGVGLFSVQPVLSDRCFGNRAGGNYCLFNYRPVLLYESLFLYGYLLY